MRDRYATFHFNLVQFRFVHSVRGYILYTSVCALRVIMVLKSKLTLPLEYVLYNMQYSLDLSFQKSFKIPLWLAITKSIYPLIWVGP